MQQRRSNVEARTGVINILDSTDIKPQWRDQFPKTSLGQVGYIGDTYPLCNTGTKASFLTKGSNYKLFGEHSEEGEAFDKLATTKNWKRFTPDATSSPLYTQLCGVRNSAGKCSWPTEVILTSTLTCHGDECLIDRIRTVKMMDGGDVRWYSYVPPPCITMTFFDGVRISSRFSDSRWSCANPIAPVRSKNIQKS